MLLVGVGEDGPREFLARDLPIKKEVAETFFIEFCEIARSESFIWMVPPLNRDIDINRLCAEPFLVQDGFNDVIKTVFVVVLVVEVEILLLDYSQEEEGSAAPKKLTPLVEYNPRLKLVEHIFPLLLGKVMKKQLKIVESQIYPTSDCGPALRYCRWRILLLSLFAVHLKEVAIRVTEYSSRTFCHVKHSAKGLNRTVKYTLRSPLSTR